MYKKYLKRALDILISLLALIVLSPVIAVTALAVKLSSPGPVLFKQTRLGLGSKEFKILKFRSMVVGAEHTGSGVYSGKGDARVTKVGKFIRATSIDELPQLVNILRGDMSLIGPRPPLTYHPWTIDKYTPEQLRMFEVRPGITGWAQVNGYRGDTSIRRRIEYDLYYIENWTLWFDFRIMFLTVFKGFINKNAY